MSKFFLSILVLLFTINFVYAFTGSGSGTLASPYVQTAHNCKK